MNLSRRRFGAHVTGAAVGATLAACGAEGSDATSSKRAVVLVHGSWFGAWCFSSLIPLLTARNITVVAPDLPGHAVGARFPVSFNQQPFDPNAFALEPSPLAGISLAQYVSTIQQTIDELAGAGFGPITLLGHSMAGVPITAAAEQAPGKIAKLIYLSAFMPVTAKPVLAYLMLPQNANSQVNDAILCGNPATIGALRFQTNSVAADYQANLKNAFSADSAALDWAAIAHMMQPDDPAQAYGTPTGATAANWGSVKRAYIGCTADNVIPPDLQQLFISEADALTPANKTDYHAFASSHLPFVSQPDALATLIASLLA
jgi:pimeloyl-ACP methyl ester carboxylesterase